MRLSADINLSQKQKLVVTQTLREAIELLQLSSLDLARRIETEITENPVLELTATGGETPESVVEQRREQADLPAVGSGDIDQIALFSNSSDPGFVARSGGTRLDADEKQRFIEGVLQQGTTLHDHLIDQIHLCCYHEQEIEVGEVLVSFINPDGYIEPYEVLAGLHPEAESQPDQVRKVLARMVEAWFKPGRPPGAALEFEPPLNEKQQTLAAALEPWMGRYLDSAGNLKRAAELIALHQPVEAPVEEYRRMHALIKTLDPTGIGAEDIRECLLIQLAERLPREPLAEAIVRDCLPLLEKRRFRQIATRFLTTNEAVEEAAQLIATLEPRPGRKLDSNQIEYVIPDVVVRREGERFVVSVNDGWMPKLNISNYYQKLLARKNLKKEEREYLQQRHAKAEWLIRSIGQRRSTLQLVMEAILEEQGDFFRLGPSVIKPLTLHDIAERIQMHESTVSRLTSNKYVQCHWGIYPLKQFFSGAVQKDDGTSQSARSVREQIRRMIENEERAGNAFSDEDLRLQLEKQGIRIARRTVAKYRKMLKILPSNRRHN